MSLLLNVLTDQKPREIAARILKNRLKGADYTEKLLESGLSPGGLSPADRRLCHELVYGVVRWERTLDWLIARKTDGRDQKPELRILLQLGLYQIFWLDRIPPHAAVNETVELAKQMGFGPRAGFVNALLRGFLRQQADTAQLLAGLRITDPALGYSHPAWLYERWSARWGRETAARLMEWNNSPAPTYARVNRLKTDAVKLGARWTDESVKFTAGQWDWTGEGAVFRLESHPPLSELPSFQEGLFYVQDPSTLLAVRELDPQPGETVLDLCAAPGGKTAFIADLMRNNGHVRAQDIDPHRLATIRENCARLGAKCVQAQLTPPAGTSPEVSQYDRILVDAPCSNTGVMRRRVDLRWRVRLEEIERLRTAQLDLLQRAAPQLKPGGTLVYSTCSLEPEENRGVVTQFLAANPQFALERDRELTPVANEVDGAYVAKLKCLTP
jgi:16S rRNA (cytosine967-C5)-methyltransferase